MNSLFQEQASTADETNILSLIGLSSSSSTAAAESSSAIDHHPPSSATASTVTDQKRSSKSLAAKKAFLTSGKGGFVVLDSDVDDSLAGGGFLIEIVFIFMSKLEFFANIPNGYTI